MSILDNIPLASIVFVVGLALTVYAYVVGDISIQDAYEYLALNGLGSGAIGIARAKSGKGVR